MKTGVGKHLRKGLLVLSHIEQNARLKRSMPFFSTNIESYANTCRVRAQSKALSAGGTFVQPALGIVSRPFMAPRE